MPFMLSTPTPLKWISGSPTSLALIPMFLISFLLKVSFNLLVDFFRVLLLGVPSLPFLLIKTIIDWVYILWMKQDGTKEKCRLITGSRRWLKTILCPLTPFSCLYSVSFISSLVSILFSLCPATLIPILTLFRYECTNCDRGSHQSPSTTRYE